MGVFLVSQANVPAIWKQVEALIRPLVGSTPTHTTDDVLQSILGNASQLWAQWDGERLEAALVTEFVRYPRGTWVRIWIGCTHPDARMDNEGFRAALEKWREAHDCRGFEVIGRIGFLRRFPDAKLEGAVLRVTMQ